MIEAMAGISAPQMILSPTGTTTRHDNHVRDPRRAFEPSERFGRQCRRADQRAAIGEHRQRHVEVIEVRIGELERYDRHTRVMLEPCRGASLGPRAVAEVHARTARMDDDIAALPDRPR